MRQIPSPLEVGTIPRPSGLRQRKMVGEESPQQGLALLWRPAATLAAGVGGTRRTQTQCHWETFKGGSD